MTTPTITGLTTSVTFAENTVNATPQIIDNDVTFTATSPDDTFTGGILKVSGLLSQDAVSVNNQGTARRADRLLGRQRHLWRRHDRHGDAAAPARTSRSPSMPTPPRRRSTR